MRKPLFTSILFMLLFTIFISFFGVPTVKAPYTLNGSDFPLAGPMEIISPKNITYNTNSIVLNVTSIFLLGPEYANFYYCLDETDNVTFPITGTREPREVTRTYENGTVIIVNSTLNVPSILKGETSLSELSEGPHKMVVYANYTANTIIGQDKTTVFFTINADSEATHIPEFQSWILLPLAILSIALVVICKKYTKIVGF